MKDWKYIMYLSILGGLLLLVVLSGDKKFNWNVSLAHEDKNPFGAYALNTLLSPLKKVRHTYKTFYELKDSLTSNQGVLVVAEKFEPTKEDTNVILQYVEDGGVLFLSASSISGKLADTLQIKTNDLLFRSTPYLQNESSFLRLRGTSMDTTSEFYFRNENIFSYLSQVDSVKDRNFITSLIASNHNNQPVALLITTGKGSIVVCSTPLIFANYCLLNDSNAVLISSLLSYIPQSSIYWNEYYQLGRREVASPLRFILGSEPLRWAYYLTIASIIIFVVFEAKRKQRIIPILKPLANSTLDFVTTIGGLYFENGDHKSIAMKKIHSFQESVRARYYINQSVFSTGYVQALSQKSGVGEVTVQQLVDSIRNVTEATTISDQDLTFLHNKIHVFWTK